MALWSWLSRKKTLTLRYGWTLVCFIEDEDHHCIWLNNCIGRRNYRYFLIFVSTAAVYAFLTAALCLTHLLLLYHDRQRTSEGPGRVSFTNDAMAKAPVSALVMVYATVMGLAVGSLASYHFWLATMNRTTHEQVKSKSFCCDGDQMTAIICCKVHECTNMTFLILQRKK